MNNKEKTKRLTISLLCCGRAETTERCLKSLMPIREAVDSEIQVVDTGCSKETRAIVEKYADEVFDFTWVNDFAAARNFQLNQANGEMFLFIDDDEFFLDCKYIIEFFNDPKCTTYNIGGYFQRNYLDFEGLEYQDIEVVRMCSVTPETHFIGKVHEYIEPASGNAMFMDARAGHYGYVYHDMEENRKHSMRNIPLLEEMMVEMPDNLRWPYQLVQELRAIADHEKLLSVCDDMIKLTQNATDAETRYYRGTFHVGKAIALESLARIDDIVKHYRFVMADDSVTDLCKARVSLYGAKVFFINGENEDCINACNYFLSVMEKIADDKMQMLIQGGIFTNDTFDENHKNTIYCYLMACGLRNDDFGPLSKYYRKISWNSQVIRINKGFVASLLYTAAKYGCRKDLNKVFNRFNTRPGLRDVLQHEIEEHYAGLSLDELNNVKAVFKDTDRQEEMDLYMDLRIMEKNCLDTENWDSYQQLKDLLIDYANKASHCYDLHMAWQEEKAPKDALTNDVKLGRKILEFVAFADLDTSKSLGILKDALGLNPIMDTTIGALSKLYGDWVKLKLAKEKDPAKFEEMYALEEAVKAQIHELESTGHTADAQTTKNQLEQILMQTYGLKTLH